MKTQRRKMPPHDRRSFSIRTVLLASFAGITLLLVLLSAVLANRFLISGFRDYAMKRLDEFRTTYVVEVANLYDPDAKDFPLADISAVGEQALDQGIILSLCDVNDVVLWDAAKENSGTCTAMMDHMATNMRSFDRSFRGGYSETLIPVVVGGSTVGTLHFGFYGPFFLSDADLALLASLNRMLVFAALISMAAALVVAFLLSRLLSRPIRSAARTANRIASGQPSTMVAEEARIREIVELDQSLDRLEATLGEQESMRRRLTADVAHELRTPLSALSVQLEMLADGLRDPTPERLRACHEETLRLGSLVGDLEGLARAEQPLNGIDFQPLRLDQLAERVVRSFEAAFERKGVALMLDAEPASVLGDSVRLPQVVTNLLSNALRHTPAQGTVHVEVRTSPDGGSILTVEDNGEGIPAEDLPHVFERFYRVDRSRNRGTGGAGIGLAITRAVVEAHHGSMEAKSVEGRGSVFSAKFPPALL
jgi:signal transduction histidine kinase